MIKFQNSQGPVLLIAVAGGSGSGKTTFAKMLQANLGDQVSAILSQDNYYRDIRSYSTHEGEEVCPTQINFDHPNSIEFELLEQHLAQLGQGQDILVPHYDFATHRRDSVKVFKAKPVIILDGILILTQPNLRDRLSYSYFIETEEALRFQRRLNRDVLERGRTRESVFEQYQAQVKPMHDLFVEPTKVFADQVIAGDRSFAPVIREIINLTTSRNPVSQPQPVSDF